MPRKIIVVIGIMMCFGAVSCNLFKTRAPDEPTENSSNDVPATIPSLVFQNMIYAFQEANSVHYLMTMSDNSFSFTASGRAGQQYGGWIDWDKSKENDYFSKVISGLPKNSKVLLEFTTISSQNSGDSCEQVNKYLINIPSTVPGSARVYKGQAQFTLKRDILSSSWYICRWTDYELNSSDSTWSDLKGSFVN